MTIDSVLASIEHAEATFRSIILSTNYLRMGNNISWKNYTPGIFKCLYAKEYETIVQKKQYSFLLRDNLGCIQFFYSYLDGVLNKVKLCYYPYPVGLKVASDDLENHLADYNDEVIGEYYYDLYNLFNHHFELSLNDETLKQLVAKSREAGNYENEEALILGKFEDKYQFTNSSHIRVDYDANVASHHKCEIQMGGINNIRLPMAQIINPFTFCDLIFKNIVPSRYQEIVGKSTYNSFFANSKNRSVSVNPFVEGNIFLRHS